MEGNNHQHSSANHLEQRSKDHSTQLINQIKLKVGKIIELDSLLCYQVF